MIAVASQFLLRFWPLLLFSLLLPLALLFQIGIVVELDI
jgi:hypothetical protein